MSDTSQYFMSSFNERIAYRSNQLDSDTTIFFFGGYASCMTGKKASSLNDWSLNKNLNFIRFDYSGHGESEGNFREGTITKWSTEAEQVFNEFKNNKNILVGSSMGGWISLILAEKNLNSVNGFIGIASAPDFTVGEWDKLSNEEKTKFKESGLMMFPDPDYGDYEVSYKFVSDGFSNLLLNREIDVKCPISLLHGRQDKVVPLTTSERIIEKVLSDNKKLIIIDDGDHSLSRKEDLSILFSQIEYFI